MTLVDTSVWIDHLRNGNDHLSRLLENGQVLCHPFVIGELACGNLKDRSQVLELLAALPEATLAEHDEVLELMSSYSLSGRGLGWIDMHLLASSRLSACPLWTLDVALQDAARDLHISAD